MKNFFSKVKSGCLGIEWCDVEELDLARKRWMLRLILALGLSTLILLGMLALFQVDWYLALIDFVLFIILLVLFCLSFRKRRIQTTTNVAVVLYGLFMVLLVAYGGGQPCAAGSPLGRYFFNIDPGFDAQRLRPGRIR